MGAELDRAKRRSVVMNKVLTKPFSFDAEQDESDGEDDTAAGALDPGLAKQLSALQSHNSELSSYRDQVLKLQHDLAAAKNGSTDYAAVKVALDKEFARAKFQSNVIKAEIRDALDGDARRREDPKDNELEYLEIRLEH